MMTTLTCDSSTLLLLSKCGLLPVTCEAFDVVVPPSVFHEVASEHLLVAYPDAALFRSLHAAGHIRVEKPGEGDFHLPITLHPGERDALRLSMEFGESVFATDDGKAVKAARFLKVPFVITPRIVVALFRLGRISRKEARQAIEKLGTIGRYAPDIIAESLLYLLEERDG